MKSVRKSSRKREAILRAIQGTKTHPSAEWIYERVKPEYPDLSLGTVYRNLSLFCEDREIVKIANVAGQERYDANTEPHAHFICGECGAVIDVEAVSADGGLDRMLEERTGLEVEYHDLIFHGKCGECASKRRVTTENLN